METDLVIVVGAGRMGSQIAAEFALRGFSVVVLARDVTRADARIADVLANAVGLGLADATAAAEARRSLSIVDRADGLPSSAALVLECLPEDLDLKLRVLREVTGVVDATVVGTNTSSLSVTSLSQHATPDRTVGMHYWSPPLLMPLVELTPAAATSPRTVELASRILERAGKVVVRVRRDVPGFIWNRLQMAVLREALWLVANEVASVATVDEVVQLGLARRWRNVGLFESVSLGGAETWETVARNLFPVLSNARAADGLALRVAAEAGRWTGSERRRDQRLAQDDGPVDVELSRSRAPVSPRPD